MINSEITSDAKEEISSVIARRLFSDLRVVAVASRGHAGRGLM
jgi:hypothetical protein